MPPVAPRLAPRALSAAPRRASTTPERPGDDDDELDDLPPLDPDDEATGLPGADELPALLDDDSPLDDAEAGELLPTAPLAEAPGGGHGDDDQPADLPGEALPDDDFRMGGDLEPDNRGEAEAIEGLDEGALDADDAEGFDASEEPLGEPPALDGDDEHDELTERLLRQAPLPPWRDLAWRPRLRGPEGPVDALVVAGPHVYAAAEGALLRLAPGAEAFQRHPLPSLAGAPRLLLGEPAPPHRLLGVTAAGASFLLDEASGAMLPPLPGAVRRLTWAQHPVALLGSGVLLSLRAGRWAPLPSRPLLALASSEGELAALALVGAALCLLRSPDAGASWTVRQVAPWLHGRAPRLALGRDAVAVATDTALLIARGEEPFREIDACEGAVALTFGGLDPAAPLYALLRRGDDALSLVGVDADGQAQLLAEVPLDEERPRTSLAWDDTRAGVWVAAGALSLYAPPGRGAQLFWAPSAIHCRIASISLAASLPPEGICPTSSKGPFSTT